MTDYALPNVSHDLSGEVAIVTGATSGLGRRFARTLAAAGAKVAISGRREDRLSEVKAEIEADGGTCHAVRCDVTDADDLKALVQAAEDALGLVTILVNNAGIPDAQFATKMEVELIDLVLDTNVRAPFILSAEVAKRLIAAKRTGRIVNISSAAAFSYGGHGAALYSVSKAAVVRMTETLSVEWARFRINVNAIAPGAFHSEMLAGMLERVGDMSKSFPRGRIGEPPQLDSTLLFLCSPASDVVTGTVVHADDAQGPR
ncbi:short-chain dehydrogenase [Pacificimonas flava]|uniref:Short-chain dehydrogenase n=2 Tax=Pacificimonas TaxID=1960290 RepID=A0A219B2W4_9SPHN|nr:MULTISPECIES: SDR family NAD(P)-dependent oxidoreductase [Pacificimonas]MBZ6378216.1 SDR family NAD(P)-dependent oxidoreductase [Pacificimonas aurantium]OWV32158.1 short-chain dehydrogenase [Pacificimonas flava]